MSVRLRSRAADSSRVGEGLLRGGGSDRGLYFPPTGEVKQRLRYSRDPAAELMPAAAFLGQEPDFAAIAYLENDGRHQPCQHQLSDHAGPHPPGA